MSVWKKMAIAAPGGAAAVGLFGGGFINSASFKTNAIESIIISTPGNATDFGDLVQGSRLEGSAMSNSTRCVFAGGYGFSPPGTGAAVQNVMEYVEFATLGNTSDFGDLTRIKRQMSRGSINSTTRGVLAGGWNEPGVSVEMQYITFSSLGNAATFGNLSRANGYWPMGCSSQTRGIIAGGSNASGVYSGHIDYITIATTGNSSTFGTLIPAKPDGGSGCSNATRGIFAQGFDGFYGIFYNTIQYITIATTGNSVDFGDCSTTGRGVSSVSDDTFAVFRVGSGGYPYISNTLEYVTISSTGNTSDFGDLTAPYGVGTEGSSLNGGVQ